MQQIRAVGNSVSAADGETLLFFLRLAGGFIRTLILGGGPLGPGPFKLGRWTIFGFFEFRIIFPYKPLAVILHLLPR